MQRSHVLTLLVNRADESEVAGAIDDQVRAALQPAIESARNDRAHPTVNQIAAEVGAFVGLVGQNWSAKGREEFIGLVIGELETLPGGLVMDALRRARRRVTDGRLLVSWICEDVEPRAAKLDVEIENLERLMEIAGGE